VMIPQVPSTLKCFAVNSKLLSSLGLEGKHTRGDLIGAMAKWKDIPDFQDYDGPMREMATALRQRDNEYQTLMSDQEVLAIIPCNKRPRKVRTKWSYLPEDFRLETLRAFDLKYKSKILGGLSDVKPKDFLTSRITLQQRVANLSHNEQTFMVSELVGDSPDTPLMIRMLQSNFYEGGRALLSHGTRPRTDISEHTEWTAYYERAAESLSSKRTSGTIIYGAPASLGRYVSGNYRYLDLTQLINVCTGSAARFRDDLKVAQLHVQQLYNLGHGLPPYVFHPANLRLPEELAVFETRYVQPINFLATWSADRGRERSEVILESDGVYEHWVTHWEKTDVSYSDTNKDKFHVMSVPEDSMSCKFVVSRGYIFLASSTSGHLFYPLCNAPITAKTEIFLAERDLMDIELFRELGLLESDPAKLPEHFAPRYLPEKEMVVSDAMVDVGVMTSENFSELMKGDDLAFLGDFIDLDEFDMDDFDDGFNYDPGKSSESDSKTEEEEETTEVDMEPEFLEFTSSPSSTMARDRHIMRNTIASQMAMGIMVEDATSSVPMAKRRTHVGYKFLFPVEMNPVKLMSDDLKSSLRKLMEVVSNLPGEERIWGMAFFKTMLVTTRPFSEAVLRARKWVEKVQPISDQGDDDWL
jgi:hypothetical protein